MTRKHFESVARVLNAELRAARATNDTAAQGAILSVTLGLANEFRRENARFDRDRFLKAVGGTD